MIRRSPIFQDRYLLLQAYDLLGQHLFFGDWDGLEADELPGPFMHPDLAKQARSGLNADIEKLSAEGENLRRQIRRAIDPKKIACLEEQKATNSDLLLKTWAEIAKLPTDRDGNRQAFMRKQRAEHCRGVFFEALRNEAFRAYSCNMHISPDNWQIETADKRFSINFVLSMAHSPIDMYPKRHRTAFVQRHHFNVWLLTVERTSPSRERVLAPLEYCESYLKVEVERGERRMGQKKYYQEVLRLGGHVTKKEFDELYEAIAPKSWRSVGRPQN